MKACPKCGDTDTGYESNLTIRYRMTGRWGEPWETTGLEESLNNRKTVTCSNCGARVCIYEATGITNPSDPQGSRGETTPGQPNNQ